MDYYVCEFCTKEIDKIKLKKILSEEYYNILFNYPTKEVFKNFNPINKYFYYWLKNKILNLNYGSEDAWGGIVEIDKLWLIDKAIIEENDTQKIVDICKNVKADTILSFWYPLKFYLENILNKQITKNINFLNQYKDFKFDETSDIVKLLMELAKHTYSKEGVMEIPFKNIDDNNFNCERYPKTYDNIWKTLELCYMKDELFKYFESEAKLNAWIETEKLNICFKDKIVSRDNLIKEYMVYSEPQNLLMEDNKLNIKAYKKMLEVYINFYENRKMEMYGK